MSQMEKSTEPKRGLLKHLGRVAFKPNLLALRSETTTEQPCFSYWVGSHLFFVSDIYLFGGRVGFLIFNVPHQCLFKI